VSLNRRIVGVLTCADLVRDAHYRLVQISPSWWPIRFVLDRNDTPDGYCAECLGVVDAQERWRVQKTTSERREDSVVAINSVQAVRFMRQMQYCTLLVTNLESYLRSCGSHGVPAAPLVCCRIGKVSSLSGGCHAACCPVLFGGCVGATPCRRCHEYQATATRSTRVTREPMTIPAIAPFVRVLCVAVSLSTYVPPNTRASFASVQPLAGLVSALVPLGLVELSAHKW